MNHHTFPLWKHIFRENRAREGGDGQVNQTNLICVGDETGDNISERGSISPKELPQSQRVEVGSTSIQDVTPKTGRPP